MAVADRFAFFAAQAGNIAEMGGGQEFQPLVDLLRFFPVKMLFALEDRFPLRMVFQCFLCHKGIIPMGTSVIHTALPTVHTVFPNGLAGAGFHAFSAVIAQFPIKGCIVSKGHIGDNEEIPHERHLL